MRESKKKKKKKKGKTWTQDSANAESKCMHSILSFRPNEEDKGKNLKLRNT